MAKKTKKVVVSNAPKSSLKAEAFKARNTICNSCREGLKEGLTQLMSYAIRAAIDSVFEYLDAA